MEVTIEVPFSPVLLSALNDKPEGVEVRMLPVKMQRDFDFTPVAIIIIELSRDVSVGAFVHWLFGKFEKKPPKTTTIRRREVTWDKGEITRVIEEEFKIEE